VRFFLFSAATAMLMSAVLLGGCARPPPVWTYYDACAVQTPSSFVAMVECGKQRRLTVCQAPETAKYCGPEGTAFMQYADGLAQSVQNHEISEAVALQRFAEYKTKMFQAIRHDQATVAAGEAAGAGAAAASGPKTCITTGSVVNCY
jgi:hypothetical protein